MPLMLLKVLVNTILLTKERLLIEEVSYLSFNMNKAYDKLYLSYKKDFKKDSPFNYDYERPAMMKLLDESLTGKSILDAGCAGG
jgi:2-polyprenyl-3-methyl-5-hydroxy-6-metoxy-1,4-benzoquinol methylase